MSELSNTGTQAIKTRCYEIIDRFHHRAALRDDDIRLWVTEVVKAQGEAAAWHATRASGFGGSDIGVLVRNFKGDRADHMNSAHDIVASKLLKSVPEEDMGDLRRGHENEPAHAKKYYEKYSAQRDEASYNTLTNSQGLRVWMRYSPDDVILMPASLPNPALKGLYARRLLIDYKAPRKVEEDDSVAFQYSCQLHQGAMICAKAGVHLDGLMLSQYDWAHWELKDDYIAYDPEISRLILQAGDHYFDYAMRGELPPYIFTRKFDREAEFIDAFGEKAQRLAQISAVGKAFLDKAESLGQELKQGLKDVRLAGKKMQLGDLAVTAVNLVDHEQINKLLSRDEIALLRKTTAPDFDSEAMASKLTELGVDIQAFRIDKIDADKAYPLLIEKGFDPEQFMVEQIRFKVANHLKIAATELVKESFPGPVEVMPELIQAPVVAGVAANENLVDLSAEQNVREAQITERPAQRTAMV